MITDISLMHLSCCLHHMYNCCSQNSICVTEGSRNLQAAVSFSPQRQKSISIILTFTQLIESTQTHCINIWL